MEEETAPAEREKNLTGGCRKKREKMKRKILTAVLFAGLLSVSMSLLPMVSASPPAPDNRGDVIVAESSTWFDLYGWDHAALYDGGGDILEADPHFEAWTATERALYPANYRSLHEKSYAGNEDYGRVEWSALTEIWNSNYYSDREYGEVIGASPTERENAAEFAADKAERKWEVGNYDDKPRPFDYKSFWGLTKTKQVDDTYKYSLGYGYYCSELVWAAWYAQGYDFDDDTGRITPNEIGNSNQINFYGP